MTNEMVQEAVLDSLDQLETSQLFAECDVLCALADTYVKSVQIMTESKNELEFDGIVIQEAKKVKGDAPAEEAPAADAGDGAAAKKGGKFSTILEKAKDLPLKLLDAIKGFLSSIANFLQRKIGSLVIKNMTVAKENTKTIAVLTQHGCTFAAVGEPWQLVQWPTIAYDEIDTIINSYDIVGEQFTPDQWNNMFDRMLKECKRKRTSETPFEGAGACIKSLKKLAKACEQQRKALEKKLAARRKEGNVDANYALTAAEVDKLKSASQKVGEVLKLVSNGTQKVLDAYIAVKKDLKGVEGEKPAKIDRHKGTEDEVAREYGKKTTF